MYFPTVITTTLSVIQNILNPLVRSHKSVRIAKISILKLDGIIKKKNSYENRDYESVDEKSLSKAMFRKTIKSLTLIRIYLIVISSYN